jgi:hypothetical protein
LSAPAAFWRSWPRHLNLYVITRTPSERTPKRTHHWAARFASEADAGQAYFKAQDALLHGPDNDLSAYRLQLNHIWHVAVLGEQPPRSLERQLRRILAAGDSTTLPAEVLELLRERRARATQLGPWVEKHQWPGEHL